MKSKRPLCVIALDIIRKWDKVNMSPAYPYVQAMTQLNTVHDTYITESASDIVMRFLANAQTWRGADAREIKQELKNLLV